VKTTPRPRVATSDPRTVARPFPLGPRLALQVMAALVCLSFGAVALLSSRRVAPDDGRLPELIPINLDGSYMRWIGKTAEGSQFLISNAFIQEPSASASGGVAGRRYFTTFYLFDADGKLKRSQFDEVGDGSDKTTALAVLEKVKAIREKHLTSIGPVKYGNINVRPFQVQRDGVAFGLIATERPNKTGRSGWQVILQPGGIVTFSPPWNGDYGN
jgi:hypothetical protein